MKTAHSIQQILWDWNGTLLNDVWLSIESINKVLERRDMKTLDRSEYRSVFGFPVIDYYKQIGFDFQKESFEIVGTEFIKEYDSHQLTVELQQNAEDCLVAFSQMGIKQSILSARKAEQLINEVRHHKIHTYFEYIYGLEDHYAKSKLDIGRDLIVKSSVPKENTILVGDTLHDYEVAMKLGIHCILFSGGHQKKATLLQSGVPVVDSFTEIQTFIRKKYGER